VDYLTCEQEPVEPASTPNRVAEKRKGRSRASNGATFLKSIPGGQNNALGRRYRDILADLESDLGGDLPAAKMMVCRRAATLAVWCEMAEAEMALNRDIDISEYTTATNALRRLLQDIGLERRARNLTPDLHDYINGRAA